VSAFLLVPLRAVTLDAQTGPFGSQLHFDEYVDDGIPVINPSNIINSKIAPDPAVAITEETSERLARHRLEPGDLVFARRGELGRAAVAHNEAAGWLCGTGSLRVRTRQSALDSRFAEYVLQSASTRAYFEMYAVGSTMGNLNTSIVLGLPIPLPPLDEQRRIADFLDAETARIDALAELYTATRSKTSQRAQCLIDMHIYNAGQPVPLKYFVKFREGPGIMAVDFRDEGAPLVRISGLHDGTVTLRGANFLDAEMMVARWSQFKLRLGDYVISGSATMGAVSVVKDSSVVGAIPYTGLIILRPANSGVVMEYVATALTSSMFMRQIDLLKAGATMQHFGPTHLAQVSIPFPSHARQEAIAAEVRGIQDQTSKITAAIDRQLALLAERRQALITAAVTGGVTV
jgi:type I restriction enzyme, S subunit